MSARIGGRGTAGHRLRRPHLFGNLQGGRVWEKQRWGETLGGVQGAGIGDRCPKELREELMLGQFPVNPAQSQLNVLLCLGHMNRPTLVNLETVLPEETVYSLPHTYTPTITNTHRHSHSHRHADTHQGIKTHSQTITHLLKHQAPAKTFNTRLNRYGEIGHRCLVHNPRRKHFNQV